MKLATVTIVSIIMASKISAQYLGLLENIDIL